MTEVGAGEAMVEEGMETVAAEMGLEAVAEMERVGLEVAAPGASLDCLVELELEVELEVEGSHDLSRT